MANNTGYGVVYTPHSLSEYVANLLIEEYNKDATTDIQKDSDISVLDPACGEGALLSAVEQIIGSRQEHQNFSLTGIDVEEDVIRNNRKNFDRTRYTFYSKDALLPSETKAPVEFWRSKGVNPTLIIANPPWSSEKLYDKKRLSDAGYRFDIGQYDSYVLFCLQTSIRFVHAKNFDVNNLGTTS
ncbi:MAG: methyltransferase domain-containing protein [Ruminococcaceae bacterium]|nr:methyltransferase domain-containing protein [Oscillospiraceae bacterium]